MEDQQPQPSRADAADLYLATLRARMDPEQFKVLHRMFVTTLRFIVEGREGAVDLGLSEDERALATDDVLREHAVLMSIVMSGCMDQRVVELGEGWSVVDGEVADDPEKLRELEEWATEQRRRRAELSEQLRGIAEASGLDGEDLL